MRSLENEFALYRITLGLFEQYRKSKLSVSEFNLVKIAKDKGESGETIEGLEKAFGGFFQKPKESASERLAEIWLSPQEKAARQAVRIVKYIKDELGLEIHQIPPKLMPQIMEGIAYGYEDDSIQSKWQKLLELSMAGKDIRAEYARILDELDPVDARILDYLYAHQECNINNLLKYVELSKGSIELEVSFSKISDDLHLCAITNNDLGSYKKGDLEKIRSVLTRTGQISKRCMIDTNETKSGVNGGKVYITVHFSALGGGFMNCVTKELKPNPSSDTSSQTSAS